MISLVGVISLYIYSLLLTRYSVVMKRDTLLSLHWINTGLDALRILFFVCYLSLLVYSDFILFSIKFATCTGGGRRVFEALRFSFVAL